MTINEAASSNDSNTVPAETSPENQPETTKQTGQTDETPDSTPVESEPKVDLPRSEPKRSGSGAKWKLAKHPEADLVADGMGEKVGLIWIGTQFYKTPQAFAEEANRMGVSRRIQAVPKGFELGKHYVWFAHPHVREVEVEVTDPETGELKTEKQWQGGVFRIVQPTRIEKIVTQTQSEDEDEMTKLADRGITAVVVPDDDRDHQGSVYDDDASEPAQTEMRV